MVAMILTGRYGMADKKRLIKKPITKEIAGLGGGLDISNFIGDIAQPDDNILQSRGGDLSFYRKLLKDDQVQACLQQRLDAVVAAPWSVEPGGESAADKEAAEFLSGQLHRIDFDGVTRQMLMARFWGFTIAECLWEKQGFHVILGDVRVRRPARFRFTRQGELRLVTQAQPQGIILPAQKFWVLKSEGDHDDSLYGQGLAQYLYWPVFLKRNGLKFWALSLEKFGQPTVAGKYPPGTAKEEVNKLLELLRGISTDTAVAMPEGMAIELIEAQRRAGGDHVVFCQYMDTTIARIILGQPGTTEIGPYRGTADVHKAVRDQIITADAGLLCSSFNQGPAKWLTAWNFPTAEPPRVVRSIGENLKDRIAVELQVAQAAGRPLDKDYAQSTYGLTLGDALTPQDTASHASFATSPDAIEQAADDTGDIWQAVGMPMIKAVSEATSFDEAKENLTKVVQKPLSSKVAEHQEHQGFFSRLAGRLGEGLKD